MQALRKEVAVFTGQFGGQVNVMVLFRELDFAVVGAEEALVGQDRDGRPQCPVVLLLGVLLDEHQVADSDVLCLCLWKGRIMPLGLL